MLERLLQWIRQVMARMTGKQSVEQAVGQEVAVSDQMARSIRTWMAVFQGKEPWMDRKCRPLRLAVFSAAHLARLVNAELRVEVSGGPRGEYLQQQLARYLLPDLTEWTQWAIACGQVVLKPVVAGGDIAVEAVRADRFFPLCFDLTGRPTAAVFVEQRAHGQVLHTRLEYHRLEPDGTYTVRNRAFRGDETQLGREASLSIEADWGKLEPVVDLAGVKRPLFACLRMPMANNIEPGSRLPISLYANALDTLAELDRLWGDYCWEFHSGRRKLIVDETAFTIDPQTGRRSYPDPDLYEGMNLGVTPAQPYGDYTPQVREEAYRNGINQQLRIYEAQTGVSPGTYSFDTRTGAVTATQVLSEDKATFWTVGSIQRKLHSALEDLSYAMDTLATLYRLAPAGDWQLAVEFGDGVFEDTNTEFLRRSQLVTLGVYQPWELRMWYLGETEEQARQRVAETLRPDDIMGYRGSVL